MSVHWLDAARCLRVGIHRGTRLDDVASADPAYLPDLLYVFGAALDDADRTAIEAAIAQQSNVEES